MTMLASIYGRLGQDPTERTTKSGATMMTASMAVDVTGRDSETETLWVNVLAFGTAAEALMRATKGEMISCMGRTTRGRYRGRDGVERESWTLLADSVITARSARPNTARPNTARRPPPPQSRTRPDAAAVPFNDDLSF